MKKLQRCEKNSGWWEGCGACDWGIWHVAVSVGREAGEDKSQIVKYFQCQAKKLHLDPAGWRSVSGSAAEEKVDQTWVLE